MFIEVICANRKRQNIYIIHYSIIFIQLFFVFICLVFHREKRSNFKKKNRIFFYKEKHYSGNSGETWFNGYFINAMEVFLMYSRFKLRTLLTAEKILLCIIIKVNLTQFDWESYSTNEIDGKSLFPR